ncbi:MAG TPA: glycine cleavage system aminomethyltransferase GcvT [Candidatus Obscuribacterales bacterium]
MTLLRTPLHALSADLNARFTEFAGWEMAVQYSGIKQEHQAVRTAAGMFDISHMGKFCLRGRGVLAVLQRLVPSDLSRLRAGSAQYTVLLNEAGGIIDDLIIYDQGTTADGSDRVTLIVNAATTAKDKAWLVAHLPPDIVCEDMSRDRVLIAVQGPGAIAHLQQVTSADLSQVGRFGHLESTVLGADAFFARTGYTGEDGFEVMVAPTTGQALWQTLLDQGVVPCGLGARDTLRLEAAMALYGQDITDATTPLEAGLQWLVHLDGAGDFIGRSRLEQQSLTGPDRRLVGLQLTGRNIARHDYPVLHEGQPVGVVTSGTLAPTLGYPVALAYVPTALAKIGQPLAVAIRGQSYPAQVVRRPFYRRKNS